MNALRDAGPHLIEVIVKDNDTPWCERFHGYRQVVSGCLAEWPASILMSRYAPPASLFSAGLERGAVTLMYDKPPHIGIGMPSEVSSRLIKIAGGAGVVDV